MKVLTMQKESDCKLYEQTFCEKHEFTIKFCIMIFFSLSLILIGSFFSNFANNTENN